MHPYDLNPGPDSLRWLQMAEKLLTTRDLIGSKSFATKALESDPNSEAAEQILAIVDTLIAGDKQMSSNHLDWYSILQLGRRTHDSELIGLQYKRLGVLLNPNRNKYPFAEHAYKLVTEAWLVLSNPSRKFQFDNEFGNSNSTHFNFIQTHFETQQSNESRGGTSSGRHFDFMQEGSGEQLHESSPMQFVQQLQQQQLFGQARPVSSEEQQQQQQLFGQARPVSSEEQQQQQLFGQARPVSSEEQQQQRVQSLSEQLHWSNQGKQPLVRPQPQPLLRPHSQQTWFQQPEPQTHIQHPLPQSQPHIPQQLPQQPSHWAQLQPQSQPQSQPKRPLPEPREQSTQPLHWAQHVPQHPPLSQSQPQSWMQQALPMPQIQQPLTEPRPQAPTESRELPQQPLHSSQTVSQLPQQPQQPWMQQSLPSPQIQTSSPEPRPQPEKTPPESQEWANNDEQFSLGENGDTDDNHENNVNVEEPSNFWTVCAYCYSMYEYSGIYADCTLRCQNCKKAFHAVRTEAPPAVSDGEDAYICCWGYFPIGISMSYLEKRKAEASSWQPFSKMFTFPRGGNTSAAPQGGTEFAFPQGGNTSKPRNPRNSGPRIYIDDDEEEDIFAGISSNEDSDDEDWHRGPKNKKTRSYTRKASTPIKVKQPQAMAEMVRYSNTGNLHSGVVVQDGSGVTRPDAAVTIVPEEAVPIVPEEAVPIVPEAAVPSVPVPKAAMDGADKNVVETSKKKVSVPIRKQPSRVAKDLGKLDGVVAQEGLGASVPDAAEVSVSPTNQPKDWGKPDGIAAQEGSGVSASDTTVVSVPQRKQPGRVAKDLGNLDVGDVVVAQEGSGVGVSDAAEVSVHTKKQPGRDAKDLGKLDGVDSVVAKGGSVVSIPDVAAVSVPARKKPGRVAKDSGKLDGVGTQEGLGVSVPDVAAPSVPVAEANTKVMVEAEKKAVGGSSKKRVSVPTRKQPGRVAKDLGKLDLNVEFNNEVEGPARGTSGGRKAVNGAEENVDGVAFFEGLDEYLSSLPILSADAGDKAKAV